MPILRFHVFRGKGHVYGHLRSARWKRELDVGPVWPLVWRTLGLNNRQRVLELINSPQEERIGVVHKSSKFFELGSVEALFRDAFSARVLSGHRLLVLFLGQSVDEQTRYRQSRGVADSPSAKLHAIGHAAHRLGVVRKHLEGLPDGVLVPVEAGRARLGGDEARGG